MEDLSQQKKKYENINLNYLRNIELFINVLSRVRHNIMFYPSTHPAIPKFIEEAYDAYITLIENRPAVLFEFIRDVIIIDKLYDLSQNYTVTSFGMEMYRRGFTSIEFTNSCDKEPFSNFVRLLSVKGDDLLLEGGVQNYLKNKMENAIIKGISFKEIDYEKLMAAESEESRHIKGIITTPEEKKRSKAIIEFLFHGEFSPSSENKKTLNKMLDNPNFFVSLMHDNAEFFDVKDQVSSDTGKGSEDEITSVTVMKKPELIIGDDSTGNESDSAGESSDEEEDDQPTRRSDVYVAGVEKKKEDQADSATRKSVTALFQRIIDYQKQLPIEIAQPLQLQIASLFFKLNQQEKYQILNDIQNSEDYSESDFVNIFKLLSEKEIANIIYPLIRDIAEDDFDEIVPMLQLLLCDKDKRNLVIFIINYQFKSNGIFNIEHTKKWKNFVETVNSLSDIEESFFSKEEEKKEKVRFDTPEFWKMLEPLQIKSHYLYTLLELMYHLKTIEEYSDIYSEIESLIKESIEEKDLQIIEKTISAFKVIMSNGKIKDNEIVSFLKEKYEYINKTFIFQTLVDCYRKNDEASKNEITKIIEGSDYKFGADALQTLIVEEDRNVRRKLIQFIVSSPDTGKDVLILLRSYLNSPQWYVVRNALTILKEIGSEREIPIIKKLLNHQDIRVVREAISVLGRIGGIESLNILIDVVTSGEKNNDLKIISLKYLGGFEGYHDRIIPVMKKVIYKFAIFAENSELKLCAIENLGQLDDDNANEELGKLLSKSVLWHRSEWLLYKKTAANILRDRYVPKYKKLISKYL